MRGTTRSSLLASGLLALASSATAQLASVCPSTNVCFKLNIPASTASSGSGDIFFQISAPSSYEWVALGQGRGMSGSNIFMIYTSSDGKNVTLSPRTASGYNQPSLNNNAQVTLLEGSGVSNGLMTANVKCSNCNSWSGGSMDFKASSGNWIYGYQSSGGPKNSNDRSANIREHSAKSVFSWEFANAKGGSSVNPLVNANPPAGTGTGTKTATSCIPRPTSATASGNAASPTQSGDSDNDDDDRPSSRYPPWATGTARPTGRPPFNDDASKRMARRQEQVPFCDEISSGNGNGNGAGFTTINAGLGGNTRTMLIAHGVLASLAFVILFPAGAIAIRLASVPGIVWIHGAFQVFAYLVYIAGFGLGVYLATQMNLLNSYHPIIGIVVLVLIFFQPIFGFLHHSLFKKHNSRTLWSYAHIWLGRIAITLGIINGGLGLKLADSMRMSSKGGMIAYGVIAGIMWLAWVAAMFFGEKRRKQALATPKNPEVSLREVPRESRRESHRSVSPLDEHYAPGERR